MSYNNILYFKRIYFNSVFYIYTKKNRTFYNYMISSYSRHQEDIRMNNKFLAYSIFMYIK